jgi:hypothetical protein
LQMINSQPIDRHTKHQVMLIKQSKLCTTIPNIYNEVYQRFNLLNVD